MENIGMNKEMGTKWFTFYTKFRPFLLAFSMITAGAEFYDFIESSSEYLWISGGFLLFDFSIGVIQFVLSLIVCKKSKGNYYDFVHFVKGVLLFETIAIFYKYTIQQLANNNDIVVSIIVSLVWGILAYLFWYRLNVIYFEKRIIGNPVSASEINKNRRLNEISKYNNVETTTPTPVEIRFCRKCGEKLFADSKFCPKCGTEISTLDFHS